MKFVRLSRRYGESRAWVKEILLRPRVWFDLRSIEEKNPIIVYQMGKVGSSSVVAALRQIVDEPVIQVHTLTRVELSSAIKRHRATQAAGLPEHLIVSARLLDRLDRGRFPFRTITLTREPVSRAISHVFEANKQKLASVWADGRKPNADDATKAILELLRRDNGISDPTQWFENELQAVTGVDVFEKPYDKEVGFTMFESRSHPVLIFRMEDLNRSLSSGLSALLGSAIRLPDESRSNDGSAKWYGPLLSEVKSTLKLPAEVADRVFGTKYFAHFYGHEEAALRARWL